MAEIECSVRPLYGSGGELMEWEGTIPACTGEYRRDGTGLSLYGSGGELMEWEGTIPACTGEC